MSKRILIVGGAGFIGNSLTKVLQDRGQKVVVVDTEERLQKYLVPLDNVDYQSIEWPNVNGIEKLGEFDDLVHLAWSSNPSSSMQDIELDAKTNVQGTLKLLTVIKTKQLKLDKVLFMSSGGTVYGNSNHDNLDEQVVPNPISAYGISKLACEHYTNLFSNQCGFTPLCVRLGNPYGEYQLQGTPTGVIANFVGKLHSDEQLKIYGDGSIIRDYIHIDDVTHSLYLLLLSPTTYGTYNLGSGLGVTVLDTVRLIEKHSSKKFKIEYLPERTGDVRSVVLNSHRIQNELNYQPVISLDSGISGMVSQLVNSTAKA